MATPTHTRHRLPGYLGDILIDVRTGNRAQPRPAVLVLHGFKGFKDWGMFPPLAERIARAGFTAVSFNVTGSGVDDSGEFVFPDRFAHATYTGDLGDLRAVLDAVAAGRLGFAPPPRIGILGHSRGGGLGILATAGEPRVSALVTWSAISSVHRYSPEEIASWRARGQMDVLNSRTGEVLPIATDLLDDVLSHGAITLDILGAAARVRAPWLILHGEQDVSVPVLEARALDTASAGRAELRVLPAAGHTFEAVHPWKGPTPAFTIAADATVAWFGRHLA